MKRALVLLTALALSACGADDPSAATNGPSPEGSTTIDVSMTDMAFTPATLTVGAGETVTFRFKNNGTVKHEAVIGTLAEQEEHHAEMAAADSGSGDDGHDMSEMSGDMNHGMGDLHAVTVDPGQTVELTHTFDQSGDLLVGCHEKGHWEEGMKMTLEVKA